MTSIYNVQQPIILAVILISVNSEKPNDNGMRDEERFIKEFDEVIMMI